MSQSVVPEHIFVFREKEINTRAVDLLMCHLIKLVIEIDSITISETLPQLQSDCLNS